MTSLHASLLSDPFFFCVPDVTKESRLGKPVAIAMGVINTEA
jgi:hypothetical protein